jgi:hypothetical protein
MKRRGLGMSVLEIVIGTVVFLIGIIPVLSLFSGQERETQLVGEKLLVVNRLRSLADLVHCRYIAAHFPQAKMEVAPREHVIGGDDHPFIIEEQLSCEPSKETPGLFRVKVKARWKDPTGTIAGPHEQSLQRLIADPEWGSRHEGPTARAPGGSLADESEPEGGTP